MKSRSLQSSLALALFALPLAWLPTTHATTYYVATNGNDSAVSNAIGTPYKTIQKAASLAVAGDSVLIRGGVYNETVTPAHSGTSGNPITYQAYNGESVTLSGADPITGWSVSSGNIYVATMANNYFSSAKPGDGVNLYDTAVHNQADQVFYDGQMMFVARWPNSPSLDPSLPAKAVIDSVVSRTPKSAPGTPWTTATISDSDINALNANLFTGAEIYFQPNNQAWSWVFTGYVTGKSGSQLTFNTRSTQVDDNGPDYDPKSRYFVFNKRELLDSAGEWYHDKTANNLYFWAPGNGNPEGHVLAKKREFAFNLDSRNYITIKDLRVFACTITTDLGAGGDNVSYNSDGTDAYHYRNAAFGLANPPYNDASSRNVTLDNLKVDYATHYTDVSGNFVVQWVQSSGLIISGANHVVKNCRVRFSPGNGISLIGRTTTITNNYISDVNYMATDCGFVGTGGTSKGSSDHEIAYNTCTRAGRSGIALRNIYYSTPGTVNGKKARVHHNDVSQWGLQDWDVGGIAYTSQNGQFIRIDHNVVHDTAINVDNVPGNGNWTSGGIYCDLSNDVVIDHNVIYNVEWGIHLQQQAGSPTAVNFLVYNNTVSSKKYSTPNYGPFGIVKNTAQTSTGSVIQNNIFFSGDDAGSYQFNDVISSTSITYDHNLEWDHVPNSGTDPKFLSEAGANFRLKSGSAAINAGVTFAIYNRDGWNIPANNDTAVGVVDIGAYEFGGTDWTAGSTPDINLLGLGQVITNGDLTARVGDDTDFGAALVVGVTVAHTFTVQNLGNGTLNLSGATPVTLSGANAADFSVTAQPASSALSALASTTFQITFDPTANGTRTATVSIANDDPDEAPYTFAISGRGGAEPEINVLGLSQNILTGDITPSATDGTDFGSVKLTGASATNLFTVQNLGALDLTLSGAPPVSITGANASDFTVLAQPATTIAGAVSVTFQVKFDPSAVGIRTATLSITNDDSNENPYTFALQGTGRAPSPGTLAFTASTVQVAETNGTLLVSVARTVGSDSTVAISYATADISALAGSDYTTASGTLVWGDADAATKTFSVPILNDANMEPIETFGITLFSSSNGALLGTSTLTVSILDDETQRAGGGYDFDGDGQPDLVRQRGRTVQLQLLNGTNTVGIATVTNVATGFRVVGIGDFNRDHALDLLFARGTTQAKAVLLNGVSMIGQKNYLLPTGGKTVGTVDYNGDGAKDLLRQSGPVLRGQILSNTVAGAKMPLTTLAPGRRAVGGAPGVGGAGFEVIVQGTTNVFQFHYNGLTNGPSIKLGSLKRGEKVVSVEDADNDGDLDIIVQKGILVTLIPIQTNGFLPRLPLQSYPKGWKVVSPR